MIRTERGSSKEVRACYPRCPTTSPSGRSTTRTLTRARHPSETAFDRQEIVTELVHRPAALPEQQARRPIAAAQRPPRHRARSWLTFPVNKHSHHTAGAGVRSAAAPDYGSGGSPSSNALIL